MAKFRVGDVCIGQNFEVDTERNGMECEVVAHLPEGGMFCNTRRDGKVLIEQNAYCVHWADGLVGWVAQHNLRKKPPKEKKGSWEQIEKLCGWNPTKVNA